jgi:nicotianamine synthase
MELGAILSVARDDPKNIAFIGSGPLPLSSLLIADYFDKRNPKHSPKIHNIDHDPLAIAVSSKLCSKLGQSSRNMQFMCTEASNDSYNLRMFDIVYVAALVGATEEQKHKILSSIVKRMKVGAMVVLRSAHSLRTLLYPVSFLWDSSTLAFVRCANLWWKKRRLVSRR